MPLWLEQKQGLGGISNLGLAWSAKKLTDDRGVVLYSVPLAISRGRIAGVMKD